MKEKELLKQVQNLEERIINLRSILADYSDIFTAEERLKIAIDIIDSGRPHPMYQ